MKTKIFIISVLVINTIVCTSQTIGTIHDEINGINYKTITVGKQTWMDENLKSIKYNDGSPIVLVTNDTVWDRCEAGKVPAYYSFNDSKNTDTYILYNWYVVNTGKVCPKGWRVPIMDDYNRLLFHDKFDTDKNYYDSKEYSDSTRIINKRLSFSMTTRYNSKRIPAVGLNCNWTSTKDDIDRTNSYAYNISHDNKFVYKAVKCSFYKNTGCNIRCIKD